MQTYRMIIKTETATASGKILSHTDEIPNLVEGELDARREAARMGAPRGAIRTIKVVGER